jgi:hypothetical protein
MHKYYFILKRIRICYGISTRQNKQDILKLISIFNGNLLTERKINQFKLWLEAFNKAYNMDIRYIHNNNNPTLTNAWLAGFSDADFFLGSFSKDVIPFRKTNYVV